MPFALIAIAAHDLDVPAERLTYEGGDVFDSAAPQKRRSWMELVNIAHRHIHRMPPDTEPGLERALARHAVEATLARRALEAGHPVVGDRLGR